MIAQETPQRPLLSASDRLQIEYGDWPARPLIEAECLKRDVPYPLVLREHSHTIVAPPPPAPEPPDTLRLVEMQARQNRSEALVIALSWCGSVIFCGLVIRALLRAVT
jgi:hypothetical protein